MKTQNLIFAFMKDNDGNANYVALVPKTFWEKNRHMNDQSNSSVRKTMEKVGMFEAEEWVYEFDSELSEQEVRKTLTGLGMSEDEGFSNWLKDLFG